MDANSAGGLHLFDACASKTIRSIQCEDVEMIMSANLSAPTGAQRLAGQYWRRRLVDALKRQWVAYKDWYDQQAASDRSAGFDERRTAQGHRAGALTD
jgi:hypothetical protein